jgi:hypothetical protein
VSICTAPRRLVPRESLGPHSRWLASITRLSAPEPVVMVSAKFATHPRVRCSLETRSSQTR